jgi:hypothetical protein
MGHAPNHQNDLALLGALRQRDFAMTTVHAPKASRLRLAGKSRRQNVHRLDAQHVHQLPVVLHTENDPGE